MAGSNIINNNPKAVTAANSYGIDRIENGTKVMKFNQVATKPTSITAVKNAELPNYKYSSKQSTQPVWTPSALAYQTTNKKEEGNSNGEFKVNKQQMR